MPNTIDVLGEEETFKQLIEGTISQFEDDLITSVRLSAFSYNDNLTYVSIPNAKTVNSDAFAHCSNLERVDLKSATSISNAFSYSGVRTVWAPNLASISSNAFSNSKLKKLYAPRVNNISNDSPFRYCYPEFLIIGTKLSTVCKLNGRFSISKGSTPLIYVPDELVEDYKSATNWDYIADQIKGISEYTGDLNAED